MGSQSHAPSVLPLGKYTVPIACVGYKEGLQGDGIIRLHQDSIPVPSSLYRIAIQTGKGKGVSVHVTKSNSGSRRTASIIHNHRTGWNWLNLRTGSFYEQEMVE